MMGWLCFLAIAFVTLVYLAVDLVVGSNALYLYHKEGQEENDSFPVAEYLIEDGKDTLQQNHPIFLYEPDSPSDYRPGPRIVEFYAPW